MNLSNVDLNLLKVLDALLTERNVTRAGEKLGRSQPAVSNALNRLRTLLGDELLVRGPSGFVLTSRAVSMRQPLRDAISLIENCLRDEAEFDSTKASGVFRLSTPDRLNLAVVPPLLDRLQKLAPNMELQVLTADRNRALEHLEDDQTDLALGWFDEMPNHFESEFLLEEALYCVFRRNHPLVRSGAKYDITTVLSFPHVVVSATGGRTAIFDDLLIKHGMKRRALVSITNFTAVPYLLAKSDMIGVFTKLASEVFEQSFKLAIRPVPLDVGNISTHMIWPTRLGRDQKHQWLRNQIRAVYRDF